MVAFEVQQFPNLQVTGPGQFHQSREADVATAACFDVLVVFVAKPGFFGKRLLAEPAGFPDLFYPRQQLLCRFVCHGKT